MDLGRIIKWVIIAAILFFGWKLLGPILREPVSTSTGASSSAVHPCGAAAARASERWGGGIGRFVNSNDSTEWALFRGSVESRIAEAEAACNCAEPPCQSGRAALRDLRTLVSDVDDAFRRGAAPPTDIVQRQEAIDNQIDVARGQ